MGFLIFRRRLFVGLDDDFNVSLMGWCVMRDIAVKPIQLAIIFLAIVSGGFLIPIYQHGFAYVNMLIGLGMCYGSAVTILGILLLSRCAARGDR